MDIDPLILASVAICLIGGCSAIGGCVAYMKRRPPLEGVALGLLLGPIGVLIECRHPYTRRPMVDQKAWSSLRSMMTYQQTDREFRQQPRRAK